VVVEATARVKVEVPEPGAAIEVGLKLAVTPVGCPVAESAMAASKPPEMAAVMVEVPLFPWTTDTAVGFADKLNVAVAVPASAFSKPLPFGLPQPVARSYPLVVK
jgi:hypothetical protein